MIRLEDAEMAEVYAPTEITDLPSMVIVARTAGSPESLAQSAASIARNIDASVIPQIQMLRSVFRQKLEPAEKGALAISILGFVAQLLACLGILGVVAYAVSQRTREIGIRMALGARPAHVLGIVLRQFTTPVTIGLLAGIGCAAGLSQILRRVLYGISNLDPIAYLTAIGLFAVTVGLASVLPARRALRINPTRALRCD
jgi:ABC-type antimicrobial peptide transport system permease subunit